jgi:hypothetical protein
MDHIVREQALDFFFKPTENLLQQYGRYGERDEVAALQAYFDVLREDLSLAFDSGEIYEAYIIRQELKRLCHNLQQQIEVYKQQITEATRTNLTDLTDTM